MALLNELRHGLFLPKYDYNFHRPSFSTKLVNTIRIFALQYGLAVIFGIVISLVSQSINYDLNDNQVNQAIQQLSVPMIIFLTVVFAPFTEEITFRLYLKYSPFRFGLALGFSFLTILSLLEQFHIYTISLIRIRLNLLDPLIFSLVYIAVGIFIGLLIGIVIKAFTSQSFIERIYKKIFPLLFYSSVIIFGFMHITNYTGFERIWMYAPILVLPQLVIGLFLGYVRMRYGFCWSVLLHGMHNLATVFPVIFLKLGSTTLQNSIGTDVQLDIEKLTSTDALLVATITLYMIFMFLLVLLVVLHGVIETILERGRSRSKVAA